jgi:hypothetical protein
MVDSERAGGNPAASAVIAALEGNRIATKGVQSILERMELRQSPGLYRILPAASGSSALLPPGFAAQSTRLRVKFWVVSAIPEAAGTPEAFGVQVGRDEIARAVISGNGGTLVIPLEVTIDRGAEVTTTGLASSLIDSFLIVVTE